MVSVRMSLRRSSALLSRAGRSLGRRRPANIRLSPGVPRRLRPNPRQTYFVILNEVKNLFPCEPKAADGLCRARRRKTNEVQSNICILTRQILRRYAPQNDNAVFALNHFLSGTHSSARPGRLRGSRLWARAGPGRRADSSLRSE